MIASGLFLLLDDDEDDEEENLPREQQHHHHGRFVSLHAHHANIHGQVAIGTLCRVVASKLIDSLDVSPVAQALLRPDLCVHEDLVDGSLSRPGDDLQRESTARRRACAAGVQDGLVFQAASIRSCDECQTVTFDFIIIIVVVVVVVVDCSKNRDAGCRASHIPLKCRFAQEKP